jgi:hypothetical protein
VWLNICIEVDQLSMEPKGLANAFYPGVHGYSVTTVCQNIDILTIFIFSDGRFKVKEEYSVRQVPA